MSAIAWLRLAPVLLLLAVAATPAAALQLVTEDNPPFSYTDNNNVAGMSTEVLTELGKRTKLPLMFALMPWGRAYELAQSKQDVCIYSAARLENRERIFKWVGPIATNSWGLFAKNDFKDALKNLADARPYRIGGVVDDAKVEWLKSKAVTNIVTAAEDKLLPPMLTLDRKKPGAVDLWVTGLYAAKNTAAGAGVKDIKLLLKINEVPYWLACNPGVSGSTIKTLSDALEGMRKDGSLQKINKSYEQKLAP